MTLSANTGSGLLNVWDDAVAEDITISNGGELRLNRSGVVVNGAVICSGGKLVFNSATNDNPSLVADANGATIDNTIIKAGGSLTFGAGITSVNTGKKLTLDFTDGSSIAINDLGLINGSTTVSIEGVGAGT